MKILEVNNISKRIGKRQIIKNISFSVEEGEIFGFLGPNGAGKTTTIKMLVGLIQNNGGEIIVCGNNLKKDREKALKHIGAIVESPALYEYLSGYENLMQIARIRKLSKKDVDDIIELIGLKERIHDKVGRYSLGMKQRLGIGMSLIGDKKLLILDEPTNGLDPFGIMELRDLMKKLAKERNIAVFISSHILREIEQICDTVAFVSDGEIKAVEKLESVLRDELSPLELKFIELTKKGE